MVWQGGSGAVVGRRPAFAGGVALHILWNVRVSESCDTKPPVELRKERRQRVLLSGLIFVPKTHSTFDCSIRDLSETGARISVSGDSLISTRFLMINIKGQVAYDVQCVRRKGREMALKILRPIPLEDTTSSEALQLRRLLVERLHR